MNIVMDGVQNCTAYIDDVVVFDFSREGHLHNVDLHLRQLDKAGLVVNLTNCEVLNASVEYGRYVVGRGKVSLPRAQMESFNNLNAPDCRSALQKSLNVIGLSKAMALSSPI